MRGKTKCRILKEIRQRIADENDIPYVTRECGYQGECSGTCPKCEEELRYLENELRRREALGKSVAVAALCAGMAMSASACTPIDVPENSAPVTAQETVGSVPTPVEEAEPLEGAVAVEEVEELAGEPVPEEPEAPEELTGRYAGPSQEPFTELAGDVAFLPDE